MQRSKLARTSAALMSCLVAMSFLGPSSSLAQDSPVSAVDAFFDALEEKRFDDLGQYVCEAYRDGASDLSPTTGLEASDIDPEAYLEALSVSFDDRVIETLDGGETDALVSVSGSLAVSLEEAMAREVAQAVMGAQGTDASEDVIESVVASMMDEMSAGSQIATEVEVVREGGVWLVCTEPEVLLESSASGSDPGSVDTASGDALCDLISLDELNGLGPLQYSSVDASVPGSCFYASDMETSFHSLGLSADEFNSVGSIQGMFGEAMDMRELTVAGRAALSVPDLYSLYVETDRGLLVVTVITGAGEEVDEDYAVRVAELALPRFLEGDG